MLLARALQRQRAERGSSMQEDVDRLVKAILDMHAAVSGANAVRKPAPSAPPTRGE